MKKINFKLPKGMGQSFSALLRQSLIETSSSVKPVAFKLDEGNMYKCGDSKVDNMKLVALLADLTFISSDSVFFPFIINVSYKSKLTTQDIINACAGDIDIVEKDVVLLEDLNNTKECSIKIILDKNSGYKSNNYNRKNLERKGIDIDGFDVISSNYYNIDVSLAQPVEDMDSEFITLNVISRDNNETIRIHEAVSNLTQLLQEFDSTID